MLIVLIGLVGSPLQPGQAVARIAGLPQKPLPQYHSCMGGQSMPIQRNLGPLTKFEHGWCFAKGSGFLIPRHGSLWVFPNPGSQLAANFFYALSDGLLLAW